MIMVGGQAGGKNVAQKKYRAARLPTLQDIGNKNGQPFFLFKKFFINSLPLNILILLITRFDL
ncbi:hypothetical protein BGP_2729 [Beggiatoa sp. PS]|nr:hypothetical protein BGP_2729 [Beggiatoa sp. PS]